MQLNAYLVFNGQCEEAFKLYEQVLRGKIQAMFTHAGTPAAEHTPPEWLNKIMHVSLKVGDSVLMGSDAPPDRYKKPGGFSVNIALQGHGRGRTHLCRFGRRRHHRDADPKDFLGRTLGYGHGPLRHSVDGQLRRERDV